MTAIKVEDETRTVTIRQIIEAVGLNGYPQGRHHLLNDNRPSKPRANASGKKPKILDACAYGQAALNLGVDMIALTEEGVETISTITYLYGSTYRMNDRDLLKPKEIATQLMEDFSAKLDVSITVPIRHYEDEYSNYQGRKL